MRLDKFLKVSRIIKRRTVANTVCTVGRVSVNGRPAKPSVRLKEGDVVSIVFGNGVSPLRYLLSPIMFEKKIALRCMN